MNQKLRNDFKQIEQKYLSAKLTIEEQIVKDKENFLRIEKKLTQEEYNWLWNFFIREKEADLSTRKDEPEDYEILEEALEIYKNLPSYMCSRKEFFDCVEMLFEHMIERTFVLAEDKKIVESILSKIPP